jgi:small subunit ribosomal protein S8
MVNYPVGDFLIRVKNAALARRKEIVAANTKELAAIAQALKKTGFLEDVKKEGDKLSVSLVYKKKEPYLMGLKLVSKPGLRIYMKAKDIEKVKRPSTFLISTPKGILSSKEAVSARLGGEVIAEVW